MAPVNPDDIEQLLDDAAGGRRAALARLLSVVERGGDGARVLGRLAHPRGGQAYTVGITGAPGAGKSTLTNALCATVREAGDRIAVLAIDPSSPFSGGAILGDRIRMGDHTLDDGVFIRSMATRGHLGGLSLATPSAVRVLDAVGFPWVVVETVGVGQVEVEIVGSADTCVVVVNPGWGDAVQANKAGLMEIADVFVVNKADRAGAAETQNDLEGMLSLKVADGWRPPVVPAVATSGEGVADVWTAVADHRRWLDESGEGARRRQGRVAAELRSIIAVQLAARAAKLGGGSRFEELRDEVLARDIDPWSAVDEVLASIDSRS
ncbi:MAG TPA: methylmalonyl Co-A mutase-associated GTPase MeaB [Microthrixaceae bacterium]|jgi:LAO/AO transport system kinase|nr:methylmalonyl Co-A mutase-associated GTPase MeaB [Microthrixaceae bacterium]